MRMSTCFAVALQAHYRLRSHSLIKHAQVPHHHQCLLSRSRHVLLHVIPKRPRTRKMSSPFTVGSVSSLNSQIHASLDPSNPNDNPSTHVRDGQTVPVPSEFSHTLVLAIGITCVDIVASVPVYPNADAKVRCDTLLLGGGGNASNAMVALRRLGVRSVLFSAVGDDEFGRIALEELKREHVDISNVRCVKGVNTGTSIVVTARDTASRTCIHKQGPTLREADGNSVVEFIGDKVGKDDDVKLVVIDGRHTEMALHAVKEIKREQSPPLKNSKSIKILLDVEREREFGKELLQLSDIVVTNSTYPFVYAPDAPDRCTALLRMASDNNLECVISTYGARGAMLVKRLSVTSDGAGKGSVSVAGMHVKKEVHRISNEALFEVLECPAWPLENVVDTTGAGDAYVAAIAYGIVAKLDAPKMMCLAAKVAAMKCTRVGARGSPRRDELDLALFAPIPLIE